MDDGKRAFERMRNLGNATNKTIDRGALSAGHVLRSAEEAAEVSPPVDSSKLELGRRANARRKFPFLSATKTGTGSGYRGVGVFARARCAFAALEGARRGATVSSRCTVTLLRRSTPSLPGPAFANEWDFQEPPCSHSADSDIAPFKLFSHSLGRDATFAAVANY
jgi:hypothetical protein